MTPPTHPGGQQDQDLLVSKVAHQRYLFFSILGSLALDTLKYPGQLALDTF